MSLSRRVGRLEAELAAPLDAAGPATWMASLERLVESLPDEYQQIVTVDLWRLAEQQPETITDAWYRAGIRRLTVMAIQIVEQYEAGLYVGRLTMPAAVAVTLCDTFESADKRPVGRSGDFHLWNFPAADTCDRCGWHWWSPRLRDSLLQCPGCDSDLDLCLSNYELECLREPTSSLLIPEAKREQVRAEVWGRAVDRLGVEGAEQYLMSMEAS